MDEVFKTIRSGMLQVPSVGEIHSQDPSDFTIVVEFDAVVTDNLALERPDEDLILDMYVFVPSQAHFGYWQTLY